MPGVDTAIMESTRSGTWCSVSGTWSGVMYRGGAAYGSPGGKLIIQLAPWSVGSVYMFLDIGDV